MDSQLSGELFSNERRLFFCFSQVYREPVDGHPRFLLGGDDNCTTCTHAEHVRPHRQKFLPYFLFFAVIRW